MTWEPQAQDHLEKQQTKFGYVEDDVYYGGPVTKDLHANDAPRGYPDVYVNGEDVTVTVDPLKNAQWLLPHNSERHSFTVHRGALKDHASVMRVAGAVDSHEAAPVNFLPTRQMIDGLPKFTPRCTHTSSHGRANHGAEWGKLPAISQGIYNNLFADKPDWLIEQEVNFMSTHADRTRFFDCGTRGFPTADCRGSSM